MMFREKVRQIVRGIAPGAVMTYGQVAAAAGKPAAARAVGNIMARNQDLLVPCHRVVFSDGSIGAYNGLRGQDKVSLLQSEGVTIKNNRVVLI